MNFDELKKSWQEQPTDEDLQNPNLKYYKEVGNIMGKLRKNIKREFISWVVCMGFLFLVPILPMYKIEGYAAFAYYFFYRTDIIIKSFILPEVLLFGKEHEKDRVVGF
jgi:hypothetical protein